MNDFIIKELTADEYQTIVQDSALKKSVINPNSPIYRHNDHLSEKDKQMIEKLGKNMGTPIKMHLAMFDEDKLIGWSFGYQSRDSSFYMCESGIHPDYRRRGLYTRLMNTVIEKAFDMGFQEIHSQHRATNNAVLIPKMKAGFKITALDIREAYGVLVALTLFKDDFRNKILDYRVGEIKPDEEMKKKLGL